MFSINIKSHFLLAKAFLPSMKESAFGRFITAASVQSLLGASGSSAYVASKHAALGLMKTLAAEYGQFGITAKSER
ncbi:MAG: hypothetical protein COV52_04765 [Gammaproteobacteria bacterium CG11_big_fil_rev_8_21_14_0_20_46_22]|nr:MAG: hypothetical protein COW05_02850 [Gammaproteobacteria bacterium CG12_big_fil_rev_8_21_14_0_65_46_12]PIR11253.1 MAG: hypothetical protein COV52_04765 [Gammaproteobacteria bacterium CG11_big_fil_rev_8_21_14_0_20_46_22]